ncbi:MAG: 4Fe-4S dicluster domain-containing protein [Chloroflexi bacterium]|nr:4Fe-4S dicluster domain-containing protein [Chloroflexota bacterium]MBU1747679.1 4Fe-4S dicluster domain-containing protein [Chloroflexota bacterium]MBU1880274.1 4Fe-4S dicluster domain-containing protein [Chloroflexota bacterium]
MEKILVIDHEKCTGCRLCEMVCSVKHTGMSNPSRSRIHIVKWPLEGFELPMVCQQCEEAPCIAVCPKDALSRDVALGRVVVDYNLCIGCKMCVMACPFGGMGIDTVARQVIKCDLCDGEPACVRFCDPDALQFVPANTVSLVKKRDAGLKLSEVMRRAISSQ